MGAKQGCWNSTSSITPIKVYRNAPFLTVWAPPLQLWTFASMHWHRLMIQSLPCCLLTPHSILNEFHWHSLKDRKSVAMCPLAFIGHMYRSVSAVLFSMLSTTSLILKYVQPKGLWPTVLCGRVSTVMSGDGLILVSNVSDQKSIITLRPPLGTFATLDAQFDHVHIDLVGPLPPSNGSVYLLTCIDCFMRWPEAIPIPDFSIWCALHCHLRPQKTVWPF